jgi:hypothetical protein
MRRSLPTVLALSALLALGFWLAAPIPAQEMFRAPETILTGKILRAILEEVSGQIAFNNEAMMAGYNRIRTPEEMKGLMYEADYLSRTLKGYGLDEVTVESLSLNRPDRSTWWVGHDAELRLVSPEPKLLARLVEQPALIIRSSDTVDCEGQLVFLDRRDMPKLAESDLAGKIILTSEYPSWFVKAFEKGALGIVSYENSINPLENPDQVMFDMRLEKGKPAGKVFGFRISARLGTQLRDMILQGQKVVVHAKTKTAEYPWKADTVFAAIRGTAPEKKGLMFTAHLFERPAKIGANDNVSGCVVLAEVARTLAALIKNGQIPRPERSVYFLMSEEGSGTAAYFKNHPDMAAKVLGDINMDMVGENLDANSAFFYIETPLYSKTTFLDTVAKNFADYVFRTNIEQHGVMGLTPGENFPIPIVEKNGSRQSFRFLMQRFSGGSDHGMFIESDADIPALSFMVWPDRWYHTDQDTPDKSDPTQLKRVAFIGTCAALAVTSGVPEILENLIRTTFEDRRGFVMEAFNRASARISERKAADAGKAYRDGLNDLTQAVKLAQTALVGIRELVLDKPAVLKYLEGVIVAAGRLLPAYAAELKSGYALASEARGLKVEQPKPSADDAAVAKLVPAKVARVLMGDFFPFTELFNAFGKDQGLQMLVFGKLGAQGLIETYILIDGKRNLSEIRDLLGFEFGPLESGELLKLAKALEAAKLIQLRSAK